MPLISPAFHSYFNVSRRKNGTRRHIFAGCQSYISGFWDKKPI
uniref:Uncharacterized protein n=1 Tax=Myoviridae sp. ctaOv25 TaxID=2827290 RepID=A0A8S5R501_9CAUD|nr:MAG TPA: hypothetical protein [Myoviridae sp. ctaOv25]